MPLLQRFEHLTELDLASNDLAQQDVAALAALPKLQRLVKPNAQS
jgi:hypothetical protein